MFFFSLEYGMETTSWCAELAFRTRVSMSAIGSVMVMWALRPSSPGFRPSAAVQRLPIGVCRGADLRCQRFAWSGVGVRRCRSPRALGHARQLARVGHLAQADAAQAELAVHRVRTPALLAAGVA